MKRFYFIKSFELKKGLAIVRLQGSITYINLPEVQHAFREGTKNKDVKNVLFDLKDVPETDTAGIAALVDLARYMKEHHTGGRVGLINISKKVKELLKIFMAEPLFAEFDSEDDALKKLT